MVYEMSTWGSVEPSKKIFNQNPQTVYNFYIICVDSYQKFGNISWYFTIIRQKFNILGPI